MLDCTRLQQLIASLQARAQHPLPAHLIALRIAGVHVGDAQPDVARFIARHVRGFRLSGDVLDLLENAGGIDSRTALLAEAALKLRDAGLLPGWRNEMLAVGDPVLASIERAACRPLGITTQAVHLNAYVNEDSLFVARRSMHKQIDPGRWDNLVGGMVAARESLLQTLEREAWEEAGLRIDPSQLTQGRRFHLRRPVAEGFQSEIIHVYDIVLPPSIRLANQDGEVAAIERRTVNEVVDAIERDEFTLEAALVMLESLTRASGTSEPYY